MTEDEVVGRHHQLDGLAEWVLEMMGYLWRGPEAVVEPGLDSDLSSPDS